MRPGYFNKFSSARIGLAGSGIGSNTKLLAKSAGCFDGSGGGFISWLGFFCGCLEEEVSKGAPDRLVEVSTKRIVAKELHCKLWRADEGTQIPGELCAQKKVTCEPAK